MVIKAVKFRKDGFYTQPFVFCNEEGPETFDKNVRCRGSLQNYLIDLDRPVPTVLANPGFGRRRQAANTSARSAAAFTTPRSTAESPLKICPTIGSARGANSKQPKEKFNRA